MIVEWRQYLVNDPEVCSGKLTAKGTRVLVDEILGTLADTDSTDEVLRHYPSLKREHVRAALSYAAELAHEESLVPLIP